MFREHSQASRGNRYSSRTFDNNFNSCADITEPFKSFQDSLQDTISHSPTLSRLLEKSTGLTSTLSTSTRAELEVLDELKLQTFEKGSKALDEMQSSITQATIQLRDGLVSQAREFVDKHPESVHELEDLTHKVVEGTEDLAQNVGRAVKSGLSTTYRGLKNLYSTVVEIETKIGLLSLPKSERAESIFQANRVGHAQESLDTHIPALIPDPQISRFTALSKEPLIGLIDSGFNANNPDIDRNRLIIGQDRVSQDDDPLLNSGEKGEHGTAMLGIIRATQNNGIGIDGINGKSPIWLGRAIGSGKVASSIAEFVDYSKNAGYQNAVLNLSMDLTQINSDGSVSTRTRLTDQEREAIAYAQQNCVIIVVAAGNNGGALSSWSHARSLTTLSWLGQQMENNVQLILMQG